MHILWEHLESRNLPSYDSGGGIVASWQNNEFLHFRGAPEGGPLRPPWSPLKEPAHWAPIVMRLLNEPIEYPDAIVCFAWTGELLQVAVARTTLVEGNGEPPSWYVTRKAPRPVGMKITGACKLLLLNGHPCHVLWQITEPEPVKSAYIWPTTGVHGVLPTKPGMVSRSIATGKIHPDEVEGPIEVKTPVVSIRNGLAAHPGPEGFRLETLIVVNENGTWSPAPVWVGQKLDLAQP